MFIRELPVYTFTVKMVVGRMAEIRVANPAFSPRLDTPVREKSALAASLVLPPTDRVI
jgi:hypothetical protein